MLAIAERAAELIAAGSPAGPIRAARRPGGPGQGSRDGAVMLTVTIAAGLDGQTGAGTLGLIHFRDDVPDSEIVIYPDAIAALVSTTRFGTDDLFSPAAFRDRILGRVLGRALAHESATSSCARASIHRPA